MAQKIYRPHFATTTDARVVQTREALRKALLELLKTKSLEQITIREIAAAAGVGYTTFFRHHQSKEGLLHEIAADEVRRLVEMALPVFEASDTRQASLALCTYVDQHRTLWSILLTGGAAATLREEFMQLATDVADSRAPRNDWLPPDAGITLVVSGTIELLAWWLRQSDPLPVERIAMIFERVITSPVVNA